MKTRFILIPGFIWVVCSLFTLHSNAQENIPNGVFESWQTVGPGPAEDPLSWGSRNQQSGSGFPVLVTKTTDANSGTYSVRLVSDTATIPPPFPDQGFDTIPGQLFLNGSFSTMGAPTFGKNFTDKPDSLKGYVKGTVASGDILHIHAELYQQGSVLAEAIYVTHTSISNYTMFSVPFVYILSGSPDTLQIKITAGDPHGNAKPDNVFYVDDLEFVYNSTGINEINGGTKFFLYPNPVNTGNLNIINPSNKKVAIQIYDIFGRLIKSIDMDGKHTKINTADIYEGMYFYKILDHKGFVSTGKIMIQ